MPALCARWRNNRSTSKAFLPALCVFSLPGGIRLHLARSRHAFLNICNWNSLWDDSGPVGESRKWVGSPHRGGFLADFFGGPTVRGLVKAVLVCHLSGNFGVGKFITLYPQNMQQDRNMWDPLWPFTASKATFALRTAYLVMTLQSADILQLLLYPDTFSCSIESHPPFPSNFCL